MEGKTQGRGESGRIKWSQTWDKLDWESLFQAEEGKTKSWNGEEFGFFEDEERNQWS